ncbi:MAG TPA: gamma-glutamyltransferase [Candidatus Dormibacteraeota bacterium]|nr:gamma-glutamyltransferase [Candidatus Dormibacteraeota bacterium]
MSRSEWRIEKTEATGRAGMVVADDPRAAEAGADILRSGGNAVDAAVAAALVMGVVDPLTSGIGGVAAMVVCDRDGRTVVFDGSGIAPRAARADMFELLASGSAGMYGWPATKDNEQNEGPRSIGVPGALACYCLALQRRGRLGRAAVFAPAIAQAERAEPVPWQLTEQLGNYAERLWRNEEAARVFYRPSRAPLRTEVGLEPGDTFAQPDLARTLRRIAERGAEDVYRGDIARAIVDDVRRLGGVLALDDLAAYEARELEPLVATYRDVELRTLPGGSGATTVIEALNIIEGFDGLDRLAPDSAPALHLIAESSRIAFADRFAQLSGDDAAAVAIVTSKETAAAHRDRGDIDRSRARPEADVVALETPADTTHVSVVDADGMSVALTATLGQAFGSGVVARGTGVLLADVMTWFDPRPGSANSIAPGKRILWAIAPIVALRERRPWLVIGSPGGRRLITAVFQAIVNMVDFGLGPQAAVNSVRVHCEGPATLLDARASSEVRATLAGYGHQVRIAEENFVSAYFGRANAIRIDAGGVLRGGVHRLKSTTAVGL